jgi:hypothetical protein
MAKRSRDEDTVVESCLQALARPERVLGGLVFRPLLFEQQRALEQGLQALLGEEAFLFTMPLAFTVRLQQQTQGQVVMDESLLRARALALLRTHAERVLALLAEHTGYRVEQLGQLTASELYEAIQHMLEVVPLCD